MRIFRSSLDDEKRTIKVMITMYCNSHHISTNGDLCQNCTSLVEYAIFSINKCVLGSDKPTCEKCPVHCYNIEHRNEIRIIMQYAGPRMIFKHPFLTIRHMIKNRKGMRSNEH